jgi:DNA invertase Pin-like site-specific DNA recombinase
MDRPILNAIMERIRRGESRGIVVYRLDRFARTLIGGYTALSELVEHGGEFASASEPQFDFTMPQGRLFLQLSLGMADYFRELNKENWETAARSAVERGVHVAPTAPSDMTAGPTDASRPTTTPRSSKRRFACGASRDERGPPSRSGCKRSHHSPNECGPRRRSSASALAASISARPSGR